MTSRIEKVETQELTYNRRKALILASAAGAFGVAGFKPAMAADGDQINVKKIMQPKGLDDRILGAEDAKVTVIEYASPTCPHCAAFHVNVYPAFKEQYIDTGKVKFILRPFVRNILDAVVFMLAETTDDDETYHDIVSTFFETQSQWAISQTPKDEMLKIALQLGFTEESFEAALTNQELFAGMEQMREQALEEFDLTGTPTFYVDGKTLSGDKTLEELAAAIDPKLS